MNIENTASELYLTVRNLNSIIIWGSFDIIDGNFNVYATEALRHLKLGQQTTKSILLQNF